MRIRRICIGQVDQKLLYIQPDYHAGKCAIPQIGAFMCSLAVPLGSSGLIISKLSVVPEIHANHCVSCLHAPIYTSSIHSWTSQDLMTQYICNLYTIIQLIKMFFTAAMRHLCSLQVDVQLTDMWLYTFFNFLVQL